jgi:hypothetical protein
LDHPTGDTRDIAESVPVLKMADFRGFPEIRF